MKDVAEMTEIRFRRDTSFRKQFFVPDSFSHPAKMDAQLLIWITEHYTQPGETILDPMGGSGTTMLACTLGRDVVLVELEQKFIRMCLNNWQEVQMRPQLGSVMGGCASLWGDARDIQSAREHPYENLWLQYPKLDYPTIKSMRRHYNLPLKTDARRLPLLSADKIVTSPPYAEGARGPSRDPLWDRLASDPTSARYGRQKHPSTGEGYSADPSNIGNLPYGDIDKIVTSPPFAGNKGGLESAKAFKYGNDNLGARMMGGIKGGTGDNANNIDALPYGDISKIITSPPYEETISKHAGGSKGVKDGKFDGWLGKSQIEARTYSDDEANIGNLKSDSYLEAMLQVYRECHRVLRGQGLMILVVKPFIRNQQLVPLQEDTKRLGQQAGFSFIEEHHRILPSQSFWRVIYAQRFPDAPKIDREYVLVFKKGGEL